MGLFDVDFYEKLKDVANEWDNKLRIIVGTLYNNKIDTENFNKKLEEGWTTKVFEYLWRGQECVCKKNNNKGISDNIVWHCLSNQNGTYLKINYGDFFSLMYFLHEVQELKSLEVKKLNKDNENKDCHRDALKYEFSTVQGVAEQMGYIVSVSALFEEYPPYKTDNNGADTKKNDKVVLGDWLTNYISEDEINAAKSFYQAIEVI